jgi:integrase
MGTRNISGVRKVVRGGKPRWFIDFPYTDKDGVRQRFRRDASVQNYAAALAEAARLMRRAAETGSVEEATAATTKPAAMTYAAFVSGPLVRTVLRAASESGLMEVLPECPRGLVVASRKVADAPSQDEVEAMLLAPSWLGMAIALAAMAGLRMGEVRALEVRDIGFDEHRVLVRRAMSEEESLTPKSGHEREVPLAAGLETRLREAVKDKLPRARVVLDEDGRTPRRQEVLYVFKRFLRREGLRERSFHSLRHYFISELMKGGASAEAAGHSKLEMTQRYAHAAPADLRAAIDKLGK